MKQKSIQEWISIDNISDDGIIKLKNQKYVKIMKIVPINYNLKSDLEKNAILNSYKIFLKTCNFNIQILVQSKKEDLQYHISNIQKNIQKPQNQYLKSIAEEYLEYIQKINLSKKSSTKEFYIIIENEKNNEKNFIQTEEIIKNELREKFFKIKECLARCGNSVIEISNKKETIEVLYSFFNTRKNLYYTRRRDEKQKNRKK